MMLIIDDRCRSEIATENLKDFLNSVFEKAKYPRLQSLLLAGELNIKARCMKILIVKV